jgi:biopolymer transport protein ExbB
MNIFEVIRLQIETGGTESGVAPASIATAASQPQTIMEVIIESWYIMLPLGIMSVLAVYIFVERFLSIRKSLQEERDFMLKVKTFVEDGKLDAAKQVCASTDNPMARMVEKGIARIGKDMKDIAASIENVAKLEVYRLEARLSVLATIAGAAPMLGFLGTVIGMMSTFGVMRKQGVDIQGLSGGIMEAMVTTVGGLIVGIIAYVAYNYLVAKVEKVIQKMERTAVEFLDILEEPGK